MSDSRPARRRGKRGAVRPSPAALGPVRVDADFAEEYPDGDAASTEAHATIVRTGQALLAEIERCMGSALGVPQTAGTALAVIDGSPEPLTPTQISERMLTAGATITATLDLLEDRGWIRRTPNPDDRRSSLVSITDDGRAAADRLLAGVRQVEVLNMSRLTLEERLTLVELLDKVLQGAAALAAEPPIRWDGRRVRPARLDPSVPSSPSDTEAGTPPS